ncbi:UNVERIFIED_CONTAM: hypothetical protein FKN15_035500, partial [Acipenser sinensis]
CSCPSAEEVAKLQKHLALLRQEYVKMQQKLVETERKCTMLAVQAKQESASESFISRLLAIVADLYQQDQYSDLKVKVGDEQLSAHKFVLAAHTESWSLANLAATTELDLSDAKPEVAMAMLRWVYTDDLELKEDDVFLTDLMKLANRFQLQLLRERCEKGVMSLVNVRNCIRFYQTAEELCASTLLNYCAEIIASHWDDLRKDDFSSMSAQLLYKMIKSKTEFPLHKAIKVEREDVVFLYLIEMDSQLPGKLNELDSNGDLALDLALSRRLDSIASTLVNSKADVDMVDQHGCSLLHKAIQRGKKAFQHLRNLQLFSELQSYAYNKNKIQIDIQGDEFASTFLIRHSAQVNAATVPAVETPLHLVCSYSPKKHSSEVMAGMARIAEALLKAGANPNMQDSKGRLDLELKDQEGSTALWLTLQYITVSSDQSVNPFHDAPVENGTSFDENSFAARLIQRGSNPDAPDTSTGNCLLQRAAVAGNEAATLFLATHGAKVNHTNNWGETPLHTACRIGLANLTAELLQQGANPNLQTEQPLPGDSGAPPEQGQGVYLQSPLHMAIVYNHPDVVSVILEQKANALHATNNLQIIPDFSLKDSMDQTVLGLALWTGMHTIAAQLLGSGASINDTMSNGHTLLHMAIQRQDSKSALFLLEHQADINVRTRDRETALQLAISNQLPLVVDAICTRGADMSVLDEKGNPPLWLALENGLEDIASTLVRHGCDATCWSPGPGGCLQTLLHRAIDENNESMACFLIRRGQSPMHILGQYGKENAAAIFELFLECMQEYPLDKPDNEGNTALHLAVMHGRLNNVRALLTESNINAEAFNLRGQSPMHILGQYGKENAAAIFELFLECMQEYPLDKPDNEGNTVLLLAYMKGNANLCRAIVRAGARLGINNNQGINIFNYQVATKQLLFRLLDMLSKEPPWCDGSYCYECLAKFGVTTRKHHCLYVLSGLANLYRNGPVHKLLNVQGKPMHICNIKCNLPSLYWTFDVNGVQFIIRWTSFLFIFIFTIFPFQYSNNSFISPNIYTEDVEDVLVLQWLTCRFFLPGFSLSRHCGRLLCHKCSVKEIPIIKFDLNKPVRVCDICFDVLTLGGVS